MGDMGDYWRDVKDHLKDRGTKKRADNTKWSTNHLQNLGIEFESKNNSVHLVIKHNGKIVDFWPSTGRFICRSGKMDDIDSRGIERLIKYLNKKSTNKEAQ